MTARILGEFELFTDRLIGKGAWGEVYHGRQKSLNRPVAIKILKKELTQDDDFVKRFRREAETLARIADDHIIQVYSAGEEDGAHYFVMEYVVGQPLSNIIEHGHKFSIDELVHITESVARALKTAWESPARIVHRDIKPSNIMVAYTGSSEEPISGPAITRSEINILKSKIKVMDFGLAKVSSGGKETTMVGTVIGTPKYISPEQGLGNPADIRSDIYSLGIVVYEMATGRLPFEGESAVSMIRHHVYDTALVPSRFNQDIPQDMEKIIMKCIQKEPENRYAHPEQLLDDLTAFSHQQRLIHASGAEIEATVIADIVPRRKKTRAMLYSGIAGLVIIAGFIAYYMATAKNHQATLPSDIAAVKPVTPNIPPVTTPNNPPPIPTPPEVTRSLPSESAATVTPPAIDQKDEELKVKVWTNKAVSATYEEGEVIKFYFQVNKDSYIYLYHKDAAGQVKMLFPNGFNKENRLKANELYTIPDKTMNFDIKVTPPFGMEQVKAIASLQPIREMDMKLDEKGFRELGKITDLTGAKFITRSLDVVPQEARAEDICTIITLGKPRKDETTK